MTKPKISVIVPVYKVEKYLPQCIESVLSQTYEHLELLLIDDGSPDESGVICDKYAAQDKRIHVFHKKNGGVSSARNIGLENMTGEWVCFLDSDDWWEPAFLQNFIELVEDGKCDLALQGYIEEDEIKDSKQIISLPKLSFNTASELIVFLEQTKGIHNGFLWHRIYRASIFKDKGIKFPIGISFAEDGDVFFRYMKYAKNLRVTDKCGYHYRKIEGSLTSKGKTVAKDVLRYLIEAYTSSLSEIIRIEKPLAHIEKGLKLYMWRLLSAWQIEKCIIDFRTYQNNIEYIRDIITNNHLNATNGMPIEIKALSTLCMKEATNLNMQLIKIVIKLREIKQRIRNKI